MKNDMDNLTLLIADFSIRLTFQNSAVPRLKNRFKVEIKDFFKDFISNKPDKESDFVIEITDNIPDNRRKYTQVIKGNKHYVLFYKKTGSKWITCFYQNSVFHFQIIVQNILYELLTKNKGFMVHASASKIGNKAFLFLGQSGAGKSTSVALLKKVYSPLSDDFSIIIKIKDEYFFYQHPFREKNNIENKNFSRYLLGKVFFLEKSLYFKVEKINNENKTTEWMIKQLMSPNPSMMRTLMQFCLEFNGYYKLSFVKEETGMINLLRKQS